MKRWTAKNPKPRQHERPQQTQHKPRDRKPAPKRRERVATVARAEKDAEWISLLSSDIPTESGGSSDYILDTGANVSAVNTLEGLKDVKSIEPVQISGIASGVTATKSGTHKLFGECLFPLNAD